MQLWKKYIHLHLSRWDQERCLTGLYDVAETYDLKSHKDKYEKDKHPLLPFNKIQYSKRTLHLSHRYCKLLQSFFR